MLKSFVIYLGMVLAGCSSTKNSVPDTVQALKQSEVNGVQLIYSEQGTGQPVVFVHGSVSDRRIWDYEMSTISRHFHTIAYTQRYFGDQPWADSGSAFSQATHAADLVSFIRSLGLGPVHVVAWSYGGAIATIAASQHPELFLSLAMHEPTIGSLIAGLPEGKAALADYAAAASPIKALALSGDNNGAVKKFWEYLLILPEQGFSQTAPTVQKIILDNARTLPLTLSAPPPPAITCKSLQAINVPILLTVGEDTRPLWKLVANNYASCAKQASVVILPHARHDAIANHPEVFTTVLDAFLEKNRGHSPVNTGAPQPPHTIDGAT